MTIYQKGNQPTSIRIYVQTEYQTSFSYDFTEHTESEIRNYWQWTGGTIQLDNSKGVYSEYGNTPTIYGHSYKIYPTHTMTFTVTGTTRSSSGSNAGSELNIGGCWYQWNGNDFGYGGGGNSYRPGSPGGLNHQYTTTLIYDFDNLTINVTHEVETYSTRTYSGALGSIALNEVRNAYVIKFIPGTVRVKTINITTT